MKRIIFYLLIINLLLNYDTVTAGENKGLAIGYYNSNLSLKYWTNKKIGIQGYFHEYTDKYSYSSGSESHYKGTIYGGNLLYRLKSSENLICYTGIGFENYVYKRKYLWQGSLSSQYKDKTESEKIILGLEYFFKEIPNLGFSVEIGYKCDRRKDSYEEFLPYEKHEKTFAGEVGVHYYFK